jgi:hypothetical protein
MRSSSGRVELALEYATTWSSGCARLRRGCATAALPCHAISGDRIAPRAQAELGEDDGDAVALAAARVLEGLSKLRGKRIFHPHGVAFSAVLAPLDGAGAGVPVLARESTAIVRLSRSFGLPEWAPDPCGLGLRIADAYGSGRHQDFLLASSGRAAVARHALLPSRGFADRPYSSLLPYELDGRLILIGAQAALANRPGPRLADLREREHGELDFVLVTAGLRQAWRPAARLSLGRRLPADESERLALDPTNTGGGLRLAGWLNRVRGPSYRRSQAGRGVRDQGGL